MADKSDRLEQVHDRATKRLDAIWRVQEDERKLCLEDRRFYSIQGAQWDASWTEQNENAPRMEVNKVNAAIVRIFSEYRGNRIAVDFRPKDDDGADDLADALDGLYRTDFAELGGQESIDLAFEEAVGGGFGAWRLRACYEDEGDPDNDHQRIHREPIPDADQCVFFDLDAKRLDKSDAKYCFVLTSMSKEAFAEEYPDRAEPSFELGNNRLFEWATDEIVYVAEYYEVEEVKSVKVVLAHPVIVEEKTLLDPEQKQLDDLIAQGWTESRRRKVTKPRVHKYIISGVEVLEDEGRIAGCHIPIVPVYGKRWYVQGIERCAGHVRYAKDPQRIYNAEVSQLAEIAAISPHEKPIFDPEQVAGLENVWAEGNIKRHPYALARALRNDDGSIAQSGPVGTISPPQVPAALAALIEVSGKDMADILGEDEQLDQVPANTSAQAIQIVQTRADAKTFVYLDNLKSATRRDGVVWLSMMSELYVEPGRKMDSLDEAGGRKPVEIGAAVLTKAGRQVEIDFAKAKFDVLVDVGPSSSTRRDATVQSLVGMAQVAATDPELQNALLSTALLNMDGEGIDDVQQWIRKRLVASGIVQPTEEEQAELEEAAANQQQPDPSEQFAAAKAAEAMASAGLKQAQTDEAKAATMLKMAQAQAVGGPEAAPEPPDGLEAASKIVDIRHKLAETEHLQTTTAHLPQQLSIEAHNAETKRMQALDRPKIRRGNEV